jgi:hypothetical protein
VVPAAALLNAKGDEAQVMVVEQNQARSRDVKTGIQSGQQVQIVSGLIPGEVVVTEGAYGLPDKTKVKVEKAESASAEEGAKKDADEEATAPKTKDDKGKGDKAKSKDNAGKDTDKKD